MAKFAHILSAILSNTWAIEEDWLRRIYSIVQDREAAADYKSLMAEAGQPLDYTYKAERRGNVGIIPIQGPIFPKANMMTEMSGATSLEAVIRDAVAMDKDSEISDIVFMTNTPGGVTTGIDEAWDIIRSLKTTTHLHGSGMIASAGYWIASAVDNIYATPSTISGSIGVKTAAGKRNSPDESKEIEFVSSVSPRKNPDPSSDDGKDEYMKTVNGIAEVFVSHVAEGRGVSPETVVQNFGKGGVLIASEALEAGMIDHICTFESLIAQLSGQTEEFSSGANPMNLDKLKAEHREVYDAALALGRTDAKASFDSEILTVSQTNETLQAETAELKDKLATAENTIEAQSATIKDFEKQVAIGQAQANQDNADTIMAKHLADSNIPKSLHAKVNVDHESHVDDSGVLNTEAYTEAVKAEVSDWSASFGAGTPEPKIKGFGAGGNESNNEENQDAEAVADGLFDLLDIGGK